MASHLSLGGSDHHVISATDVQRLRRLANASNQPVPTRARTEKATLLKSISLDHIRKWESRTQNVSKAQREERKERQRRLDREESLRQATERQSMMQRAEQERYNSTDEVKSMRTGMMLADFAYENKRNEELRRERHEQEQRRQCSFLAQQRASLDAQKRDDETREAARKQHERSVALTQKQQLAEFVRKHEERKEQAAAEGRRIAADNARAASKAAMKAQERARNLREHKLQSVADNIRLKEIRDRERDKDAAELVKIAAYAADKERKEQMRRDVADARYRTRLAVQQRLIDVQTEALRQRISNEDDVIAAHIQQNEALEERRRKAKRVAHTVQKKITDECRQRQIAELQSRKAEERRMAIELQSQWTLEKQAHDQDVDARRLLDRQFCLDLQRYHRKQMIEKSDRERQQRDELDEFVKNSGKAYDEFVGELKRLTAATVEEYARDGKNTLPIHLALARNTSITPHTGARKLGNDDDGDLRYQDEVAKCLAIE